MTRLLIGPLAFLALALSPSLAHAQPRSPEVEIFGAVSEIDSVDDHGGALSAGVRVGLGRWFALGFDLGYGLMASAHDVQDRWWMIPTAALVLPVDDARLELGAGVGLGATSGYASIDSYARGPFDPDWAYQLGPAMRAHAAVFLRVNRDVDAFLRADFATLLLSGPVAVREANPSLAPHDTVWMTLSLGFAIRT